MESISIHSNHLRFIQWQQEDHLKAYHQFQKVISLFNEKGIEDYLVYGKESDQPKAFHWQIIPYKKEGFRLWKQFKVLWQVTLGSLEERPLLDNTPETQKEKDAHAQLPVRQIEKIENIVKGNDAFCNSDVIQRQLIYEGKEINVLYSYAPIGKEKLHFLLVPKQHHVKFSELSPSEYLESMELTQKLVSHFQAKGFPSVYLFHKTGAEAGQTVPHWHQHVIIAATKAQEFFGKCTILKNMLLYPSPLAPTKLQERVSLLRQEIAADKNFEKKVS